MQVAEVAREIKRIESEDENLRGKRIFGVADPAIFQENGGASIGEMMEREGVYWEKGDHTRLAGKMQFHHRLAFDREGRPMLQVFSTCRHFIRTIPALVYDQRDVEDVESKVSEDHIYDECRYVLMLNPIEAREPVKPPAVELDDPAGPAQKAGGQILQNLGGQEDARESTGRSMEGKEARPGEPAGGRRRGHRQGSRHAAEKRPGQGRRGHGQGRRHAA